jgi:hypothetical protein
MANTVLQNISQDERQRAVYYSRRIARRDHEHNLAIAQALQEKQIDFVIKLSSKSPRTLAYRKLKLKNSEHNYNL